MTRKPLTYDHLTIVDEEPPKPPAPIEAPTPPVHTAASELLRDISHQTMLYLHVDGVRALDEYALAQSTLHIRSNATTSSSRRSKSGPRSVASRRSSGRKSASSRRDGDM
jgi:hypothetical protein